MRAKPLPLQAGLAICAVLLALPPAASQSRAKVQLSALEGTADVAAQPVLKEGAVVGCTLVFTAFHRDRLYGDGAFLKVAGSVGVFRTGDTITTALKLNVGELDSSQGAGSFKPSAPSRAYLVGADFATNLDSLRSKHPAEDKGTLFSIFAASPTYDIILAGVKANELSVAFNRNGGEADIKLPIQLDVDKVAVSGQRIRSDKMKGEFLKCLQAMAASPEAAEKL